MPILGRARLIGPRIGSVASLRKRVRRVSRRENHEKIILRKMSIISRSARTLIVCSRKFMMLRVYQKIWGA